MRVLRTQYRRGQDKRTHNSRIFSKVGERPEKRRIKRRNPASLLRGLPGLLSWRLVPRSLRPRFPGHSVGLIRRLPLGHISLGFPAIPCVRGRHSQLPASWLYCTHSNRSVKLECSGFFGFAIDRAFAAIQSPPSLNTRQTHSATRAAPRSRSLPRCAALPTAPRQPAL